MVFKEVTLIGRSDENFEAAVEDALSRAEETLDELRWASVREQTVELADGGREYQAKVDVSFEIRESQGVND